MGIHAATFSGRAWLRLAISGLVLSGATLSAPLCLQAQGASSFPSANTHSGKEKGKHLPNQLLEKSTFPPSFQIPVEPLGFSAPGANYLGERIALVSLDFLDESHLLFTFRVPGLLHRDAADSDSSAARQIRAVVLALPAGTVAAEALWTVHDRARYLWMLKDGRFLLRNKDSIELGNANLEMKPYLHFPGPLLWVELDPAQQYLVTNSLEPANAAPKPGEVQSPATAQASMAVDGQKAGMPDTVVRILRRDAVQVMLVSRVRATVHLPINSDGYLESLRGNGDQWILNENFFTGGSAIMGRVNSTCAPTYDFIAQREVLVTTCENGGHRFLAMGLDGRRLWEDASSPYSIWPLLVIAPVGDRLARETLSVNHDVNALSPIDAEDIKGQLVRVIDAATGKIVLEAPASPPLDAGGNVAFSSSGRRLAVLNAGSIEVYDLPAVAPLSDTPKGPSAR